MLNTKADILLQRALDMAVEHGTVAGAITLTTKEGHEPWYAESGYRNLERLEPITRDTIFRLYSQTKPVTGTALMMLVERGIVDLAQPVSDFLPGFKNQRVSVEYEHNSVAATAETTVYEGENNRNAPPMCTVPAVREVTVKDLLTMTSGMPYPDMSFDSGRWATQVFDEIDSRLHSGDALGTVEIANRLGRCPLRFQPGSHWMYGTSADIIGAVIEVASGMRFGDFLRTELFEPLNMHETAFYVPVEEVPRLAGVYDNPKNPLNPANANGPLREVSTDNLGVGYVENTPPAFESGGAGLKSTIDDYTKFATMLMNGGELNGVRIMQPATIAMMTQGALTPTQRDDFSNMVHGSDYNTFMRVADRLGHVDSYSNPGEYGWDGWLGTYFANDPVSRTTFIVMYQLTNAGTTSFTRKLKNIVFTHLDEYFGR